MTYTDLDGNEHTISIEEVAAIERSGRCTLEEWVTVPTQWYTLAVPVVEMAARPGQTEPGQSSTDMVPSPGVSVSPWRMPSKGLIHWQYSHHNTRACTGKRSGGYSAPKFEQFLHLDNTCQVCLWKFLSR